MTTDLSPLLDFLAGLSWSRQEGLEAARTFLRDRSTQLDYDDSVGENWARVLKDGNLVAHVYLERPLIFVEPTLVIPPRLAAQIVILSVNHEEELFTATPESIGRAFPGRGGSRAVAGAFSVDYLWFATV